MAKATTAGDLYQRVAWDRRQQIPDGEGNIEEDFAEVFQCRAAFTYLRGGEAVIAGRLEGRQPIVVRVRASSEARQIEPGWRMRDARKGAWTTGNEVWTGPIYAVKSIAETPDRRWLDVLVEEGPAA